MNFKCLVGQMWMLLVILTLPTLSYAQENVIQQENLTPTFSKAITTLSQSSLSQRGKAIEALSQFTDNPQTTAILDALLKGKLVEVKADKQVVIAEKKDSGYEIFSAETGDSLGDIERSSVKKIRLTNRLRSKLRTLVATVKLNSGDASIRLDAVKELAKKPNTESLLLLKNVSKKEQDQKVINELQLAFALQDLNSDDKKLRLTAIETLKHKTSRKAFNRLKGLMAKDSEGHFLEADKEIRKQAKSALVKIESRLQLYSTMETIFFGLSLGAVLVLAAIGLAITFGVMGVINMAHGELMMLGAYTTYVMQQIMPNHLGLSLFLSIPAAFMVAGLVGIGIERGIIRFLYGRPLETLLATFGVSLVLQQAVRSIFSPLNRSVSTPEWMSGSWHINDFLSFTWNRFYIIIFCLLVFTVLLQILKRTRLGLEVRAVSQNRNMAKAMGIPSARVDAMTFGLGSGIAGVAGVALSQITNVGPNLGQAYIVDSFMVVVFGGVGNLWGTLVAGFTLGIANKVIEPYAGAVLAKILVLVFIILFIQKRPRGLFPQKGRAAEA